MPEMGRILIADDEETFLQASARFLRGLGYDCTCAPDATAAAAALGSGAFDLLISDINMPGNAQLEFVRDLPRLAEGLPVILVTAYPSLDSAIESIDLPVAAYLVKPVAFEELAERVRQSISQFQVYAAVRAARQRVEAWQEELRKLEALTSGTVGQAAPLQVNAFLLITLHHIVEALLDLKHMTEVVTAQHGVQAACQLYECPRLNVLIESLGESIDILEKTKTAFKSKQLGDLRKKLERVMGSATRPGGARRPGEARPGAGDGAAAAP